MCTAEPHFAPPPLAACSPWRRARTAKWLLRHCLKELRTHSANSTKIEKKAETEAIKLDGIDQYSRSQNLEFHGVSQTNNENIVNVVVKIGEVLGVDINQNDISTAYRLPQKPHSNRHGESKEPPPLPRIIARCINGDLRNSTYRKRAATKDIASKDFPVAGIQRLYVNENLTQSRKRLLWQTKQSARTRDYLYSIFGLIQRWSP